ncbi:unnamed protein product [Amoebophrya sp. A120]|nr:unnamed protein product [Amoebophrya sp. A120]|eukprot:GSA120T00013039001.1
MAAQHDKFDDAMDFAAELERELAAMGDDIPEEEEEDAETFYRRLANIRNYDDHVEKSSSKGSTPKNKFDAAQQLQSAFAELGFAERFDPRAGDITVPGLEAKYEVKSSEDRIETALAEAVELFDFTKDEAAVFRENFFKTVPVVAWPERIELTEEEEQAVLAAAQEQRNVERATTSEDIEDAGKILVDVKPEEAQEDDAFLPAPAEEQVLLGKEKRRDQDHENHDQNFVADTAGDHGSGENSSANESELNVDTIAEQAGGDHDNTEKSLVPWYVAQIQRRPLERDKEIPDQDQTSFWALPRSTVPVLAPGPVAFLADGQDTNIRERGEQEIESTRTTDEAIITYDPGLTEKLAEQQKQLREKQAQEEKKLSELRLKRQAEARSREEEFRRVQYEQARFFAADTDSRLREQEEKEAKEAEHSRMSFEDRAAGRIREWERDEEQRLTREALHREWRQMLKEDFAAFDLRESENCARERVLMEIADEEARNCNIYSWREQDRMREEDLRAATLREQEKRIFVEWPGMAAEDADARFGIAEILQPGMGLWERNGRNSWLALSATWKVEREFTCSASGRARREQVGQDQDAAAAHPTSDRCHYSPRNSGGSTGRSSVDELFFEDEVVEEAAKSETSSSFFTKFLSRDFWSQIFRVKERVARVADRVVRSVAENVFHQQRSSIKSFHTDSGTLLFNGALPALPPGREEIEINGPRPESQNSTVAVWKTYLDNHAAEDVEKAAMKKKSSSNDDKLALRIAAATDLLQDEPLQLTNFRHVRFLQIENVDLSTDVEVGKKLALHCAMLEHIVLRNTGLRTLNGLQLLVNLATVDASHNFLKDFDFLQTGCPRLSSANFGHNLIKKVPEATGQSKASLSRLVLRSNKIKNLDSTCFLRDCEALEVLDLSKNALEAVPGLLLSRWLPFLTALDLADNQIAAIGHLLFLCLQELNLENNRIGSGRAEKASLRFLPSLYELNLAKNELSEILPLFAPNLRTLNFAANRFSALPSGSLSAFPNLKNLSANQNVLLCKHPARYRRHVLRALNAVDCLKSWDGEDFKQQKGDAYFLNRDTRSAEKQQAQDRFASFTNLADSLAQAIRFFDGNFLGDDHHGTGLPSSTTAIATLHIDEELQVVEAERLKVRFSQYRTAVEFLKTEVLDTDAQAGIAAFAADFPSAIRAVVKDNNPATGCSTEVLDVAQKDILERLQSKLESFRKARIQASTKIQTCYRGTKTRTWYEETKAENRRQHFVKNLGRITLIQRKMKKVLLYRTSLRKFAASIIQRWYRGHRIRRKLRKVFLADLDFDLPELDLSEFTYDASLYENPFADMGKARKRTEKTLKSLETAIQEVEALMEDGDSVEEDSFSSTELYGTTDITTSTSTSSSASTSSKKTIARSAKNAWAVGSNRASRRPTLEPVKEESPGILDTSPEVVEGEEEAKVVQHAGCAGKNTMLVVGTDHDVEPVPVANEGAHHAEREIVDKSHHPPSNPPQLDKNMSATSSARPKISVVDAAEDDSDEDEDVLDHSELPARQEFFMPQDNFLDVETLAREPDRRVLSSPLSSSHEGSNGNSEVELPAEDTTDSAVEPAEPLPAHPAPPPTEAEFFDEPMGSTAAVPTAPKPPKMLRLKVPVKHETQLHFSAVNAKDKEKDVNFVKQPEVSKAELPRYPPTFQEQGTLEPSAVRLEPRKRDAHAKVSVKLPPLVGSKIGGGGSLASAGSSSSSSSSAGMNAHSNSASLEENNSYSFSSESASSSSFQAQMRHLTLHAPHLQQQQQEHRNIMAATEEVSNQEPPPDPPYLNSARLAQHATSTTEAKITPRRLDDDLNSLQTETLETPQSLSRPSTSSQHRTSKFEAALAKVQEEWGFTDASTAAAFLQSQKKMKRLQLKKVRREQPRAALSATFSATPSSHASRAPSEASAQQPPARPRAGSDMRPRANSGGVGGPRVAWAGPAGAARKQMGPKAQDAIAEYKRMKALEAARDTGGSDAGGGHQQLLPEVRDGGVLQNASTFESGAPNRQLQNRSTRGGR